MIENSAPPENPSDRRDTLVDLIVSDERRAWILTRYPFEDIGRPGILHVEPKTSKHWRKKRDSMRWGDAIHSEQPDGELGELASPEAA
ncbi:MAG TPA: hypothetical protein VEJ46_04850 [Candidatus Acidoferrum sp.]|nr:hypothetical protein [Candidatus Acidoferrum sp.]